MERGNKISNGPGRSYGEVNEFWANRMDLTMGGVKRVKRETEGLSKVEKKEGEETFFSDVGSHKIAVTSGGGAGGRDEDHEICKEIKK